MKNYLRAFSMLFIAAVALSGCRKDDEPEPADVIASFQYEISAENWSEVAFANYSQNASSYVWDFGDGESSTDENPVHAYAAGGTYEVTLTATGAAGSAARSESITLVDPNTAGQFLTGTAGKTWILDREDIALGIGPGPGDNSWWSFGGVTPLSERPCILDDEYTFNADGTWEKNTMGTVFVDSDANGGWLGVSFETCYDESDEGLFTGPNGEDLSAYANGGDYTFDFNTAQNSITIDGFGAYIGLAQKTEAGDNYIPVSSKTYQILNMETGDISDRMEVAIVGLDGSFAWNFYLVSYHDPADIPPVPASAPAASFTFVKEGNTVEFTNTSANATTYNWDFGDGNFSTDENPVHTYAGDGEYTVILTASDDDFQSDEASQIIVISNAVFTAADMSSPEGKVWKLDGEGCYIVGPAQGSSEWWGGLDAAGVIERACQMDDEFIFYDDGTFLIETQGEVWAEGYMGGSNACVADDLLNPPFDVYGSGTHSFSATDETVTVTGLGAYIGFNKAFNGGELPNEGTGTPASEIMYEVFEYSNVDGVERVTVTVDYGAMPGEAYWTMRMIAE